MIRDTIANSIIDLGRSFGKSTGLKTAVVCGSDELHVKMESPKDTKRDWDPNFYGNSNLYLAGYANPIKPTVNRSVGAIELDEIDAEVIDSQDDQWLGMKSSKLYAESIEQNAISQLMNPKERWQLLAYGMLALGALQFITLAVISYLAGGF